MLQDLWRYRYRYGIALASALVLLALTLDFRPPKYVAFDVTIAGRLIANRCLDGVISRASPLYKLTPDLRADSSLEQPVDDHVSVAVGMPIRICARELGDYLINFDGSYMPNRRQNYEHIILGRVPVSVATINAGQDYQERGEFTTRMPDDRPPWHKLVRNGIGFIAFVWFARKLLEWFEPKPVFPMPMPIGPRPPGPLEPFVEPRPFGDARLGDKDDIKTNFPIDGPPPRPQFPD